MSKFFTMHLLDSMIPSVRRLMMHKHYFTMCSLRKFNLNFMKFSKIMTRLWLKQSHFEKFNLQIEVNSKDKFNS